MQSIPLPVQPCIKRSFRMHSEHPFFSFFYYFLYTRQPTLKVHVHSIHCWALLFTHVNGCFHCKGISITLLVDVIHKFHVSSTLKLPRASGATSQLLSISLANIQYNHPFITAARVTLPGNPIPGCNLKKFTNVNPNPLDNIAFHNCPELQIRICLHLLEEHLSIKPLHVLQANPFMILLQCPLLQLLQVQQEYPLITFLHMAQAHQK